MAKSRFVDLDPKDDQKQYLQGFNRGYLLAEVLPVLADKIAALDSKHPGIRGFREGRELYRLEMIKDGFIDKRAIESEKTSMNYTDDWLKCFNQGYIITEQMPDLVPVLMTATGGTKNKDMEALKLGIKNCLQDKMRDLSPTWMRAAKDDRNPEDPDKPRDKGKDLDMDR
jgi:hypothetical protein